MACLFISRALERHCGTARLTGANGGDRPPARPGIVKRVILGRKGWLRRIIKTAHQQGYRRRIVDGADGTAASGAKARLEYSEER